MNTLYNYCGRQVGITAFQKLEEPEVWDVQIRIDTVLQILTATGVYKPRIFMTPEAAIVYGKEAAQHIINQHSS